MAIELQYPLGSYSISNPPSNETLKGDLNTVQTAVNAQEDQITAKLDASSVDTDPTLSANLDSKIPSQKAIKTYADNISYGMARQAIMNGNFDIWQRGTSVVIPDVTIKFQADRWFDYVDKNGGTLPTLTRSQQLLTPGDIPNAKYFTRLTTNGAGTSLGVSSSHQYIQKIENGTSKLCGNGKKVTVSFYAKSDIANKRICPTIFQDYGTGGSPSAIEYIKGTPITLTNTWTKYTATFTTNTLVGKTFGTNGDDSLQLVFHNMWGTTFGNTYVQTSVTAETFRGAGNIDIAQCLLNAGDVALPFQPKSFEEELRACQRYYEEMSYPSQRSNASPLWGNACPEGIYIPFKVTKRISPTTAILTSFTSSHSVSYIPSASGLNCFPPSGGTGSWYLYINSYKADAEL